MTSTYQKAALQAMGITLYEEFAEAAKTPASESNADSSSESSTDSNAIAAIRAAIEPEVPKKTQRNELKHIDAEHPFVKKVLSAIGFDSIQASQLSWLIHNQSTITLQDNTLTTPDIDALQSPEMKKVLWQTIKHLGK